MRKRIEIHEADDIDVYKRQGYESVAQAINLIEGKDVEKFVNSGNSIVTPANFEEEHIQELLYPFGK